MMKYYRTVATVIAILAISSVAVDATPIKIGNVTYNSQADLIQSGKRCGFVDPSMEQMQKSQRIVNDWLKLHGTNLRGAQATKQVNTYFHVITAGSVGVLTEKQIKDQFNIFKTVFLEYGFRFVLKATTVTNNKAWYNSAFLSDEDVEMRKELKVGGANTLNVYFTACEGFLGYALLPEFYDEFALFDGICINPGSVPGGSIEFFNEGKTLIHEAGHWLGLLHTFPQEFGSDKQLCNLIGDTIADTPRQATPTFGCPTGRDSCPNHPGLDPINNYMDYSDDACYTSFTPCQKNRMHALWDKYRAP